MDKTYLTNGKQLSFDKPQVMAIVNLTPDSFYDGGKFSSISEILKDVALKIRQGATIIDIGAVSSKPNATTVLAKDEISRFKVPLTNLRKEFPHIIISVDTYLSEVADMAISLGADMINDISGGTLDEKMMDLIIKNNIAYVLMHMKGNPQTMQKNPTYINVVNEINSFFKNKIQEFKDKGFDKLILDVGFGFGKTVEHNYILLKKMNKFKIHGFPTLAGLSRKSMINNVIHTIPSTALNGTTVLNTLALRNGANILRVHDVTEAQQAIELWNFYQSIRISK
jgi:dihydropteroate synthase